MRSQRYARAVVPTLWVLGIVGVACLQYGLSTAGWLLLTLAVALGLSLPRAARPAERDARPLSLRTEILALLLIVAAAALMRLWRLHEVPPGLWADEAENGLETLRVLRGEWFVFTPRNGGRGSLQFFWSAPFFALAGASAFALRLASAVIGIATVPALWLLIRRCRSARVALLAAALLALSFWHTTISRIGFDAVMSPLFDVLVALAVLSACRGGSWLWFASAGGLAALANYGYAASRLTPLLGLAAFLCFRSALPMRRQLKGAGVALVAFVVVLFPLARYAWRNPGDVLQRPQHVSLASRALREGTLAPVLENAWTTLRLFHERGDIIPRHNPPGHSMLDPVTGVLFLAGLGLAWRARWQRETTFMAVWLAAVLLFGGVLTNGAQALRTPSSLMPVCFFSALAADAVSKKIRRLPAAVAPGALLALVGGLAYHTYFVEYASSAKVARSFSPRAYVAGQCLRGEPEDVMVIVAQGIDASVVQFVAGREAGHVLRLRPRMMVPFPNAIYVFENEEQIPSWAREPGHVLTEVGGPAWWQQAFVVRPASAP